MNRFALLAAILLSAGLPFTSVAASTRTTASSHTYRPQPTPTKTPTPTPSPSPTPTPSPVLSTLGNDISYPQCSTTLPTSQAFGIVGVNNGLATTTNPCLANELAWASKSNGSTAQPKIQLYVNTANPGGLNTASWPSSGTNPYGTCDHSNSLACAYQYGWNRAQDDATGRGVASPQTYTWYLDVETANTWDSTTGGTLRNTADLEGMTAYFQSIGASVGLYSTNYQWGVIVGTSVSSSSNMNGLSSWLPGATSASSAQAKCSAAPLTTGGTVRLAQYTSNNLDYDVSCR